MTEPARTRGLTMIELLVVIALVALFAVLAAPAFIGTLASSRVQSASQDLKLTLDLMRSEAIRRGNNAAACPSTNGTSCTGGTDWSDGWMVWDDLNNDSVPDLTATPPETVIRVQGSMAASLTISGPAAIALNPSGATAAATSFSVGHGGSTATRTVCLTIRGATSVQESSSCPN